MDFETFKVKKKADMYDLAKEKEGGPQKNSEELSEKEKKISEEVAEQLQKEGRVHKGFLQKIADKSKAKIAIGTFLAVTAMASVAEARGRESFIGREAERAVGRVLNDAAKGAGEWLGNILKRGGAGETPREQERRVREIQQEDNSFNREYFQIMRQYEQDIERLQRDYLRKGEIVPDNKKEELGKFYDSKVEKINKSHSLRHRDEKGNNITGCRYPNGLPLPKETRSNF